MTAPVHTAPLPTAPLTEDGARCGACPHPLDAHDPIGLRFCRATRAGDISRGCVCRVA
ncbi:MAG: uncharacterized protein JWR62_3223 [Modestobacter sp.]|jgi:hypothetical protein|nr:uncharacterized protein [Modestobacter sp.]